MIEIHGPDELRRLVVKDIPASPWLEIDQARIDAFAAATLDDQWIHVDTQRAAAESPFGTTIAHGFLTLSLIPYFRMQVIQIDGFAMTINYGLNRVRFPAPDPSGSRIRARFVIREVTDVPGGVQELTDITIEREGQEKPVCVAETIVRHYL